MSITQEKTQSFAMIDALLPLRSEVALAELQYPLIHLEQSKQVLDAAEEWVWDADDVHHHATAEITVAHAFYGKALNSPTEIMEETRALLAQIGIDETQDYTAQTGFSVLRQMTTGLDDEDYQLVQELVAKELIGNALREQGITPQEVDLFIAVTSIPIGPSFGSDWAIAAGLPIGVPIVRICEACNSSGHGIARVLSGTFDEKIAQYNHEFRAGKPANIVLFALDDANRNSNLGGDALSPQFFSTGAAALVWKYHPESASSMRILLHKSISEETGTQYLRVPRPYDDWDGADKEDLYIAKFLKEPEHNGPVDMDPRASGAFIKYGIGLASDVMTSYAEIGGSPADIKRVIIHHPSRTVFDGAVKRLVRLGFTEDQIHWVINEGNVPAATIPIAFGRQLEDLKAGDRLLFLSFGAGGEYTCFIADLGGTI